MNALIQFATFYYLRLSALKPRVHTNAEIKFKNRAEELNLCLKGFGDINDIKPGVPSVVTGTLYKEMKRKPSVLKKLDDAREVVGTNIATSNINYCDPSDIVIIEDSSGRIRCRGREDDGAKPFEPHMILTGCIVALLGTADENGVFWVLDWCYAGYQ